MTKRKMMLAASVAGLMAAACAVTATQALAADEVHCYGVNKCKGTGACGGKDHACAGKNSCKGQGFLQIPADTCMKIDGGRLTEQK